MITQAQLQRHARQAGYTNASFFETEVILTLMLEMFLERGLAEKLAFKGGTFLRKMIFGPGGRLSTDLDFTAIGDADPQDMLLDIMTALSEPYRGLSFSYEKDKDVYVTEDGCSANPIVKHEWNSRGTKIKIQVSMREKPTLPLMLTPQIAQPYFNDLDFKPSPFPSLALEEVIAEKIRAGQQRAKVRDLWDLSELATRPFDRDAVRKLAVLKVWQANEGVGFDHAAFISKISQKNSYDESDLRQLLRKDRSKIDLGKLVSRVTDNFAFLSSLTEDEIILSKDVRRAEVSLYQLSTKEFANETGQTPVQTCEAEAADDRSGPSL